MLGFLSSHCCDDSPDDRDSLRREWQDAPISSDRTPSNLPDALNRLAFLDAELDRLCTRQPRGWGNLWVRYSNEARLLREQTGLEVEMLQSLENARSNQAAHRADRKLVHELPKALRS